MEIKRPNLFLTLLAIPLLLSCADDLKGPAGQDAAATPNMSIRGGGLITWTLASNKISFTENIVIKDHARGSTYTITPAVSAITLPEIGDVAYVELTKESGATETITKADVAQSGSIEASSNKQAVTLFERTDEGTLYIPWVQKELVSGDEWRFGTALSWYERIASQGKPSYKAETEGTVVIVPGSPETPAVVIIAGKIYANTAPEPCNLSTGPRGGLDTQTGEPSSTPIAENKAYYLYAIPAEEGRGFDLVASATSPKDGSPDGFDQWSYVGALATNADDTTGVFVDSFKAKNGFYLADDEIESEARLAGEIRGAVEFSSIPITVDKAYMQMFADAGGSTVLGESVQASAADTAEDAVIAKAMGPGPDGDVLTNFWINIQTPKTIWLTPSTNTAARAQLYGWQEDPMAYK